LGYTQRTDCSRRRDHPTLYVCANSRPIQVRTQPYHKLMNKLVKICMLSCMHLEACWSKSTCHLLHRDTSLANPLIVSQRRPVPPKVTCESCLHQALAFIHAYLSWNTGFRFSMKACQRQLNTCPIVKACLRTRPELGIKVF